MLSAGREILLQINDLGVLFVVRIGIGAPANQDDSVAADIPQ